MRKAPLLLLAAIGLATGGARAGSPENGAFDPRIPNDNAAGTENVGPAPPSGLSPVPGAGTNGGPSSAQAAVATAKVELKPGEAKKKEDDGKKFPLHADVTLDNSVGEGVFGTYGSGTDVLINDGSSALHFDAPPQEIVWGTSLRLSGSASIAKTDYSPKLGVSVGESFAIANWLPAYGNGTVYEREIIMSDLSVGLSAPAVFTEEFTGIKLSPGIGVRLPLSLRSRHQELIAGFSARVGAGWTSPETPIGTFGISYTPSVGYNQFTNVYTTEAGVGSTAVGNQTPADPLAALGNVPVAYCRSTEAISATGECALGGRQGVASLSNTIGGSWSLGQHSVGINFGYSIGFLRPVANEPQLDSKFSSGQNFNDSTFGSISYSYEVPVDFAHVSLGAGLASGQSAFDRENNFNFPFWNFWYPNSNASSAFFDVSVGI
jgi:hypothetical protein